MSDIILGTNFKLYYNTDLGNSSPQGVGNVLINELSEFPELNISSETNNFETYDSDYVSKLLSDMTVGEMGFTVNYIPTDPTHQFLDSAALNQTEFQLVLEYSFNLDTKTVSYAIVNGNIVSTQLSGDKDQVVQKNYNFTHSQVIARSMLSNARLPLYQGDFGVGSDGLTDGVDQYSPVIPTGNSFIKIPASQSGNPASGDMMGVGWTDNGQVCAFSVTKSGALGIYAKNATTAWTRIYTVTQSDSAYVPLARTINGKPLSSNITLSKSDIGLSTVTDNPQLKIASNLSDLSNVATARTNLSVYSKTEVDANNATLVPKITTINGYELSDNIVLTQSDLGLANVLNVPSYSKTEVDANNATLVPKITTINGYELSDNIVLTQSDLGLANVLNVPSYSKTEVDTNNATLVPKITTINGYELSDNIVLTQADLGLGNVLNVPSYSKTEVDTNNATLVPKITTINGYELSDNIFLTHDDLGALAITGGTITGNLTISGILKLQNALPVTSGGTGSTDPATARAALGLSYGTTAGTVAQGNDPRLNSLDGKSGGTIFSPIISSISSGLNNTFRLHVGGGGGSVFQRFDGSNWYFLLSDTTTGSYNDFRPIRIQVSNGQVEIGGTLSCPSGVMTLGGRVLAFNQAQSNFVGISVDGNAKGISFFDSDLTLKENVKNADSANAISIIENIRPVSYKFKDYTYTSNEKDKEGNDVAVEHIQVGGEHQYGVIAQEFEKLLPEGVITHEDGKKALDPLEVLGLLLTTCHEQQKMIRQLQVDVNDLNNK